MSKPKYRRVKKTCKGCECTFYAHPNARFCAQRCKDRFWNTVNPRGYGLCEGVGPDDEERGFRLGPADRTGDAIGQWKD